MHPLLFSSGIFSISQKSIFNFFFFRHILSINNCLLRSIIVLILILNNMPRALNPNNFSLLRPIIDHFVLHSLGLSLFSGFIRHSNQLIFHLFILILLLLPEFPLLFIIKFGHSIESITNITHVILVYFCWVLFVRWFSFCYLFQLIKWTPLILRECWRIK